MVVDRLRTGRLASFSPTASPPLAERHSLLQQQQWSPSYRLLPHGDTAARRLVRNGNASGHLVDRSPALSTDVALTVPAPEEILPKALPLSLCDTLRKKCSPCSSSSFSLPYPHLFDQCDLVLVCCAFSVLLLFTPCCDTTLPTGTCAPYFPFLLTAVLKSVCFRDSLLPCDHHQYRCNLILTIYSSSHFHLYFSLFTHRST